MSKDKKHREPWYWAVGAHALWAALVVLVFIDWAGGPA